VARSRPSAGLRPTALIGSAAQLRTDDDLGLARRNNTWQKLAWDFYDTIGEYRYTCDWLGTMVGKTRLYAAQVIDGETVEIANGPAADYVEALFGGPGAKAEMLRQLGIHFTVAGEAVVVGTSNEVNPGDYVDGRWYAVASSELVGSGPETDRHYRVNGIDIPGDHQKATRVYRPHPVRFGESNSASRAVLSILQELRTLTAHTMAQLNSRLASAGVWLLSDELTLPSPPNDTTDTEGAVVAASTPDEVIAALHRAASAALKDQGSAAALLPLVITAPTSAIEASKLVHFWTPLDEHSKELRDEALRRMALGMDVPPEVVTGVAETNHWAAWASDESGIKAHGEPLALTITQALTEGLLWPTLKAEGVEDWDSYVIAGDTSAMRLRPNRAKEALEMYDRGALPLRVLLRETGFDATDEPTEDEYVRWLTQKIAAGSATPEQMSVAARMLGLTGLPGAAEVVEVEGRQTRPAPSLTDHPEQGPPDREVGERRKARRVERATEPPEALVAACDVAMHRAMERAGNKLRNRHGRMPGVRAADMYQMLGDGGMDRTALLDDAWDHIRGMSQRLGVNPGSLQASLTAYAEELLDTRVPMSTELLAKHLAGVQKG
jgi:hypothetical protein